MGIVILIAVIVWAKWDEFDGLFEGALALFLFAAFWIIVITLALAFLKGC